MSALSDPLSDEGSSTRSGAAQGAAAGAAFGPWGAAIGAIVGAGIGYFSGKKKRKAKKFARMAADVKRKQQTMQLALARRDIVRQQRQARAEAVAAGTSEDGVKSSAISGAVSSADAQGMSALQYFDTQVAMDNLFQQYNAKAAKYAQKAEAAQSLLGAASGLAQTGGNIYGSLKNERLEKVDTSGYTTTPTTGGATTYPYDFNRNRDVTNVTGRP